MWSRFLVAWATFAAAMANDSDSTSITLLTFNVRTTLANDPCPCGCWADRKQYVRQQVDEIAPDMFGLQETSLEQKDTFDDLFGDEYGNIGRDSGSYQGRAGEINAIYFKADTWSLLSDSMVWLGPDPSQPSAAWGMVYYRTAVFGRFRHTATGQTVCVFNTHYETPGNDLAQVEGTNVILATMLDACDLSQDAVFFMGDMNAEPFTYAMQLATTFPPLPLQTTLLTTDQGGSWCNNMVDPPSKCAGVIDHVLYYANPSVASICVREAQIVRRDFDGCYVSDHALVYATLDIGTPANDQCNAPPPNAPIDGCGVPEANTDYGGAVVAVVPGASLGDCCDFCKQDTRCNAYSLASDGTCYLKGARGLASRKYGVQSARVLKCTAVDADTDHMAEDIGSAASYLPEDCCALCRAFDGCEAFSWTNSKCYFKGGQGTTVPRAGVHSAIVL
ncbi:Aste57867_5825 [Aphanomyces stellatus]|uniref:Aste57867_5825 protein n=1 Tax=Aphanomyces stellatus TaxID=120398 RepID=A0A485KFW5_9STRA|nr:hypothetical protein As57867_005811 [Aphanomyces stellatus]VFT82848.1 Aste57867_5825 [Aphanomyces stellatus]